MACSEPSREPAAPALRPEPREGTVQEAGVPLSLHPGPATAAAANGDLRGAPGGHGSPPWAAESERLSLLSAGFRRSSDAELATWHAGSPGLGGPREVELLELPGGTPGASPSRLREGGGEGKEPLGSTDRGPLLGGDGEEAGPEVGSGRGRSRRAGGHVSHGPEYAKGSLHSGVFNLSTTMVGAGIMGLPATFRVLGLPLGVVLLLVMALLTQASLEVLVKTCTALHIWSYGETVGAVCGRRARLALDLSVLLNNLGMCIIYLIIVGMLAEWGLRGQWWASRAVIILLTVLLFLAPLASLRHVDSLRHTSALAVATAVFFVVITVTLAVAAGLEGKLQAPGLAPEAFSTGSWLSLFSVIPVMATAYTCHYSVHPIYHELERRSERRMLAITRVSLALCTAIYLATSLAGYLLFGTSTASDILVNFDRDLGLGGAEAAVNVAIRCSYVLHIILVFPIIFYSLRNTTDSILFPGAPEHVTEAGARFFWISAGGLLVVYLGAVAVPNIWIAFEITGATATMCLSFFFPGVLALRDKLEASTPRQVHLARFMIAFSVFISVTGLTTSILNLIY